ncbi:hypothetical protein CI102_13716 [Trichoderma harzianum]|nr:hypothetical protein CI102_13716 [Trichoderma harzianum]
MKQSRKEPKPVPAALQRHARFLAATCSCVYCPNSLSAFAQSTKFLVRFPWMHALGDEKKKVLRLLRAGIRDWAGPDEPSAGEIEGRYFALEAGNRRETCNSTALAPHHGGESFNLFLLCATVSFLCPPFAYLQGLVARAGQGIRSCLNALACTKYEVRTRRLFDHVMSHATGPCLRVLRTLNGDRLQMQRRRLLWPVSCLQFSPRECEYAYLAHHLRDSRHLADTNFAKYNMSLYDYLISAGVGKSTFMQ